ncbi:zinc finger protein 653 [Arapaima gigas]
MADGYAKETAAVDGREAGEQIAVMFRRCRGRPRLTDTDRAKRRLESRKKYDVRRVYLGEAHKVWSELRRRTGLSDSGLAEYLVLLDAAYGEAFQRKHGRTCPAHVCVSVLCASTDSDCCGTGTRHDVTSLCSLVDWYKDHGKTCPHEPQLQVPELALGLPASVLWRCHMGHSFMQYLSRPAAGGDESDIEREAGGDAENVACAEVPGGIVSRTRRKRRGEITRNCYDAGEDLEETRLGDGDAPLNHVEKTAILGQVPGVPVCQRDPASGHCAEDQALWEMEVVLHGGKGQGHEIESKGVCLGTLPGNTDAETAEQGGVQELKGGEVGEGFECTVVTAAVVDPLDKKRDGSAVADSIANGNPQPLPPQAPPQVQVSSQAELYEPQTLQTVVASCQIPNGRGALEGSQVIIITGPSYEALASEGIQLNVGGAVGEEVTCTVIEGVDYNQVCQADAGQRSPVPEMDTMQELNGKQVLQSSVDTRSSDAACGKELQRGLTRSRRNRRGPVIEADGMLKMFHCPYEGCSQVYVAISSFQNHVNLVHRKGRTKVCPHPGCGKKFYLSNHLHRHMIIHSGVRDFICETCGKSFKRKNHLEVHRRTHTGETPLQCEICGYQCRQRASLNWHMKKHTSEAQYNFTCEYCGKRFEKLDSVKFHKLKSHPDKQTT